METKWPGFRVDESNPGGLESSELFRDVVGSVRDVVQSLASALQEAADRGIGMERLQELDGPNEGDPNALGFQDLGRGTSFTGQEFIHDCALIERVNGDRNVVERAIRRFDRHHGTTCAGRRGAGQRDEAEHRTDRPETLQGEPRWQAT
jgi:hypothetical protein